LTSRKLDVKYRSSTTNSGNAKSKKEET